MAIFTSFLALLGKHYGNYLSNINEQSKIYMTISAFTLHRNVLNHPIYFPLKISTNQKKAKIKVELHNQVVIKSMENLFFDKLACLIGVSHHIHII